MEVELEVERFLALPEELQEEILSWRPDLLATLSQTSHYFRRLTWRLYLNILGARGRQLFGKDEGFIVTERWPTMMGASVVSSSPDKPDWTIETIIYSRILNLRGDINYVCYITRIYMMSENGPIHQLASAEKFRHADAAALESLFATNMDLLREFRIRIGRLGCMIRDPKYAHRETLKLLNFHYRRRVNGSLGDRITLYMYLYMNAWVFNLNSGDMIVSLKIESDTLATEIERLYSDLHTHIQHLY